MANNTEQLRKDIEHTILAWSSKVSGEQRTGLSPEASELVDLFIDLHEAEATRREQALLSSLPEGLYSAHRYNTDDEMKIHLWNTNGTSYDVVVKRHAEGGEQS